MTRRESQYVKAVQIQAPAPRDPTTKKRTKVPTHTQPAYPETEEQEKKQRRIGGVSVLALLADGYEADDGAQKAEEAYPGCKQT
jgi:hypothetical protein